MKITVFGYTLNFGNNSTPSNPPNSTKTRKSIGTIAQESLFAGITRAASAVPIHPFEVMKLRLQTRAPVNSYSLPWLIADLRQNGPRLLTRGMIPGATLVGLKGAYKYPMFVYGPERLAEMCGDPDLFEKHPILFQVGMTPFIVGVDTLFQGPLRRLRNVLATSDSKQRLLTTTQKLAENPSSFWRGSYTAATKQAFGVGTTLFVDALVRTEFQKRGMDTSHKNPQFFWACMASGGFLCLINTPLDVVASKTSGANPIPTTGFLSSCTHIYNKCGGIWAFTKGAEARMIIYMATATLTSMLISLGRGNSQKESHKR